MWFSVNPQHSSINHMRSHTEHFRIGKEHMATCKASARGNHESTALTCIRISGCFNPLLKKQRQEDCRKWGQPGRHRAPGRPELDGRLCIEKPKSKQETISDFIFKKTSFLTCVYVCGAPARSPGAEVTSSCELLDVSSGNWTQDLWRREEQWVLNHWDISSAPNFWLFQVRGAY